MPVCTCGRIVCMTVAVLDIEKNVIPLHVLITSVCLKRNIFGLPYSVHTCSYVCLSPGLNGSSEILHFERSGVLKYVTE